MRVFAWGGGGVAAFPLISELDRQLAVGSGSGGYDVPLHCLRLRPLSGLPPGIFVSHSCDGQAPPRSYRPLTSQISFCALCRLPLAHPCNSPAFLRGGGGGGRALSLSSSSPLSLPLLPSLPAMAFPQHVCRFVGPWAGGLGPPVGREHRGIGPAVHAAKGDGQPRGCPPSLRPRPQHWIAARSSPLGLHSNSRGSAVQREPAGTRWISNCSLVTANRCQCQRCWRCSRTAVDGLLVNGCLICRCLVRLSVCVGGHGSSAWPH